MTQSDAQLVQEILAGHRKRYALLVQRYERQVRAAAIRIVRQTHAADDVAQEAFLRAWQRLPQLRNPKAFGPWLIKITRRCALDSLRQQPTMSNAEHLDQMADPSLNGRLDEKHALLLEAVDRLPKAQRQVIMLRYFGPHSVRDVATIVGRSVGTVTKQLSRAHRRLKTQYKESDS